MQDYEQTLESLSPTTFGSSYSATTELSPEMLATIIIPSVILGIVAYLVYSYLMGRIFKKAGEESWKAFVPVYNNWIFLEVGGQKGYWAVLGLVPLVGIASVVFMIIAAIEIGKRLGKEGVFVLLWLFVTPVWAAILAFDKSVWSGPTISGAAPMTPQPDLPNSGAPAPVTPQTPVAQQPAQAPTNRKVQ